MAEPIFELTGVSYAYAAHIPALRSVDLTVEQGSRVALIGANGTGKSTLLSILDALVFPDRGAMRAFGKIIDARSMRDAETQKEFRRKVGFVFQNPDAQLFCPTAREDVAFGPLQLGVSREKTGARVARIAERLRIEGLLDRAPHQLSVGEKRKVAIAGVLAIDCDALLLDEPTAGLDPRTTRDIITALEDEHRAGKTVVMATHDLHIVEELADVVCVFGPGGSIVRSGSPAEILTDHAFLREMNLMHEHASRYIHP
jgi:cobalt/nickel transport system ATP-binding protein